MVVPRIIISITVHHGVVLNPGGLLFSLEGIGTGNLNRRDRDLAPWASPHPLVLV